METIRNEIQFRPLHLVERLLAELDTEITHLYDDLVFTEHSGVILQFDPQNSEKLLMFIESGTDPAGCEAIGERWSRAARACSVALDCRGSFSMEQMPGKEEVSIRFSEKSPVG